MDWKSVGQAIVKELPLVGTALGGPLGGAAGGLIKMIGAELGLTPDDTTPDAVMAKIEQDPQSLLKLKEMELSNKLEIQKLLLQQDQAYLQDRQSARTRQTDSEKATGKRDYNLYVLAYLFVGGFFVTIIVMMVLMLAGMLPATVPQFVVFLLGNLFGTLAAGVGAVMQYFFGSSKGSSEKTAWMAQMKSTEAVASGQKAGT